MSLKMQLRLLKCIQYDVVKVFQFIPVITSNQCLPHYLDTIAGVMKIHNQQFYEFGECSIRFMQSLCISLLYRILQNLTVLHTRLYNMHGRMGHQSVSSGDISTHLGHWVHLAHLPSYLCD